MSEVGKRKLHPFLKNLFILSTPPVNSPCPPNPPPPPVLLLK